MKTKARKRKKNPGTFPPFPPFSPALEEFIFNLVSGMFPEEQTRIVEVAIPSAMFKKLLMLCHPDKHGNSELSHEVTRWLIEERKKHA
jgi:hypothetical protein